MSTLSALKPGALGMINSRTLTVCLLGMINSRTLTVCLLRKSSGGRGTLSFVVVLHALVHANPSPPGSNTGAALGTWE